MIKVMANSDGLRLLHTVENLSSESSKVLNFVLTGSSTSKLLTPNLKFLQHFIFHVHLQPAINSIPMVESPASVVSIPGMVRKSILFPSVSLSLGLGPIIVVDHLPFQQNGDSRNMVDVKPVITEESNDKSKVWKLTEVGEPSQCRSLRLPENMRVTKVLTHRLT